MWLFKMKKWNAVLIIVIGFFILSCEQVENLINPRQLPELDERGVVVSRDQVMPGDTVMATITATNPLEGPLQYQWFADGGSFLPPSDKDTVYWVAPFSGGLYHLWVAVSNSDGETVAPKRQVNVISTSEPVVNIIKPEAGAYYLSGQVCQVEVIAEHENGVSLVRLLVNGELLGETDQSQNKVFKFSFNVTEQMVGKTEIRVEAIARNQLQSKGQDLVYIYVGGILPGGTYR